MHPLWKQSFHACCSGLSTLRQSGSRRSRIDVPWRAGDASRVRVSVEVTIASAKKEREGRLFTTGEQLLCPRGHPLSRLREPLPPHGVVECEFGFSRNPHDKCRQLVYVLHLEEGQRLAFAITREESQLIRRGNMNVVQASFILGLYRTPARV